MKEKLMKAKEFIKEHKVEILVGTVSATVLAVIGAIVGKSIDDSIDARAREAELFAEFEDVCNKIKEPVDIGVGSMTYLDTYKDGTREFWMDDMSVNDIGVLGEKIKEHFPDVTDDSNVWALLSISNNKTETEDQ